MKHIAAVLLLALGGQEINEANIKKVLEAAGAPAGAGDKKEDNKGKKDNKKEDKKKKKEEPKKEESDDDADLGGLF